MFQVDDVIETGAEKIVMPRLSPLFGSYPISPNGWLSRNRETTEKVSARNKFGILNGELYRNSQIRFKIYVLSV